MTARPLTQQGLGGAKSGGVGGRQVQDATYFFTKLNEKKSQVRGAGWRVKGWRSRSEG